MAWKSVIYLLAIMATINIAWAHRPDHDDHLPPGERAESGFFGSFVNFPGFGFFPGVQGSFQGFFPFLNRPSSTPAPMSETTAPARRKRSAEEDADANISGSDLADGGELADRSDLADGSGNEEGEAGEDGPQERLFFSSFFSSRFVSCNFTTQGGSTCQSCTQALTCFPSNVGRLRTCKKFFPYCNNGRCSFIPGSLCSAAAATAAATTGGTTTT